MLRKKDNVTLKEFEKYGFKYGARNKFLYKTKSNGIESRIYIDLLPCHNNHNELKIESRSNTIPDKIVNTLYDLIQARISRKSMNIKKKRGRKMKIIDILNKKANGTLEDKFKFCHRNKVFTYNKNEDSIYYENSTRELGEQYKIEKILNDEVLLFQEDVKESEKRGTEENKEIEELEKISYDEFVYLDNKHIFDLTIKEYDKINELARVLNKLIKESEEK